MKDKNLEKLNSPGEKSHFLSRRNFMKGLGMGGVVLLSSPMSFARAGVSGGKITFGIISDVHADLQPDAKQRLEIFMERCMRVKPDFIIQLGDLHHGPGMKDMLEIWNRFPGDRFHVLGNHDMDHMSKADVVREQGMSGPYYSYDQGGYHFVVLDANHCVKDGKMYDNNHGNYYSAEKRDMVSPEELEWLREDLRKAGKPSILFSHEAFDDVWQGETSPSKMDVRQVIREANGGGRKKVIACFCGHHHVDHHMVIEDVHYVQINSASYYWVEEARGFSNGHMAEYKDPLFAFVTLDPANRSISIKGEQSKFKPPVPNGKTCPNADKIFPCIKNRRIHY